MERLNIPLQLAKEMIRSGKGSEMRLFCAIKIVHRDGQVRIRDLNKERIMELSGFKRSHFFSLLNSLRRDDWIGCDGTWYFIRSFKRLNKYSRTHVQLTAQDLPHFRQAIFSSWIQRRIRRGKALQQSEERHFLSGSEHVVPCSVIAVEFGISPASASRLKQQSVKLGYLVYRHRYKRLNVPNKYWLHFDPERVITTSVGLFERLSDFFMADYFYFKTVR